MHGTVASKHRKGVTKFLVGIAFPVLLHQILGAALRITGSLSVACQKNIVKYPQENKQYSSIAMRKIANTR